MGYLKASEFDSFRCVDRNKRGEILCRYLRESESLGSIGKELFSGTGGMASQRPSQVTRAFGFTGNGVAGTYSHVPEEAFYDFAAEFSPEDTASGLSAGTFDRWLKEWYQRPKNRAFVDEDDDEGRQQGGGLWPGRPVLW